MSSPGPVTPPSSPPRVPSRYSMGSSSNMVRSLLVILAIVAGLVAIVPRTTGITQPPVDAASVVSDAVTQSGGLPFEAPVGLPAGWAPTNARYAASTDGLATWQGGWSTPEGGYIAIRQTKTASPAWVKAATSEGTPTGRVDVGGRTWARYQSSGVQPRTSLVDVPSGAAAGTGIATVVTATAAEDELATFVTALRPAQPR